jgi:primosomal protein N' (replication factor Y) (superfamily II helicase)
MFDFTALRVALPLPLPHLFDYAPPGRATVDAGWIGCRVRVPFGRGHAIGVVAEVGPPEIDPGKLKPASERLDTEPLIAGELLASLRWAAGYYQRPLGEVLAAALPVDLRQGKPLPDTAPLAWRLTAIGAANLRQLRAGGRPRQLADWLAEAGALDAAALNQRLPDWRPALRSLMGRGFVEECLGANAQRSPERAPPALNPEQAAAAERIRQALGQFDPILIEGVTGSGKTEVYLDAIEAALARGEQALILVPEIGLTPQTLRRFQQRLPVEVHSFHSGMAEGARARAWTAMRRGEARVLVGTRSAVFAPLPQPGLIIIDEEHDSSYKQQDGFRYHARDFALVRGKALGIPVVLGSATPALETLQLARSGRLAHVQLKKRAAAARAPHVRVLDARRQRLTHGLSEPAFQAIAECLQRGEQALVFRNRRGYAPALLCHDCGFRANCSRCDAALTLHGRDRLICHHCGHRERAPSACPDCGSLALMPQGAGTERVEVALAERFPDVPLVRIDSETTRDHGDLARHFDTLGQGAGLIVGTQMLAKGHDLAKLSLVVVVTIDEGLFSADFRAAEKLAQLLIQVSGRAGRAQAPGQVLLQTHHPEHPLLATLLAGGYPAFAKLELAEREAAGFPPFAHLALLRVDSHREDALQLFMREAHAAARAIVASDPTLSVDVHAPMPAPMARRAGRMRAQMLLSAKLRPGLQAVLRAWNAALFELKSGRGVRWSLDVDPGDLY